MEDDVMSKIAVVTGASSGLGREFVVQISEKYKTIDEIYLFSLLLLIAWLFLL